MRKCLVWAILLATNALAQGPSFTVASIKPASPNHPNGAITVGMAPAVSGPGRVRYPIINPRWLVSLAYSVPATQVDGPEWMNSDYFEVNATYPVATPPDQIQAMLQNLLAERFGLRIHRETRTRQAPVFNLVVAKGGARMRVSKKWPASVPENTRFPVASRPLQKGPDNFFILPPPPPNSKYVDMSEHVNGLHIRLEAYRQTLPELAATLGRRLRGTVADATGLSGEFDYKLTYSKEDFPPAESWPDIFDAVQSQLGLRLEKTGSTPVETTFIVIGKMEKRPTEN